MPSIRFHKLRGRLLYRPLLFLTAFVVWFEGCTLPKEPAELWWDIDLVVPMGARTYGVWDLADPDSVLRLESSGIGMDSDSNAYFSIWTEMSIATEDCLYLAPAEFEALRPVTAIQVPINLDSTFHYSLGSLNPEIAALHGTTQDIGQHMLEASRTFTANELVNVAMIDTGSARLVLINGLPYPISDLNILWGASQSESTITMVTTLNPGEQVLLNGDLANAPLEAECFLKLSGMGMGGNSMFIDSTARVILAIQVDTVTSAPYYGVFPEQQLYGDTTITLQSPHHVEYTTIRSGSLRVELENQTQLDDSLTMVIPEVIDQLGDSVVVTRFVPAGNINTSIVDLTGLHYRSPGTATPVITGRLLVHSQQTTDVRTFEAGLEYARGRIEMSRVVFSFFRGELHGLALPIAVTGVPVDRPPNGWETVRPLQVDGFIHFENVFGGEANLNLDFRTLLGGQTVGETSIEESGIPMETDTVITAPGLVGLLDDYPDSALVQGELVLNGSVSIVENSSMQMALEIQAPLMITIHEFHPPGLIERIDTGDLRDIQSGSAEVTVRNRLPVGGHAFLVVARDSLDLLIGSGADVDTVINVAIPVPQIVDGRAVSIASTETTVVLSDSLVSYFQNPPFFARTDIEIPNTEGDTLIVHGSDYLSVRMLARLVYQVRTGEEDY